MCNHCHVCTPLYTQIGEKPDNSISAKSTIAVYIYNMYRYIYIYIYMMMMIQKELWKKKHADRKNNPWLTQYPAQVAMAIDSFLAMLATGFCQLLCLRSERGQPMWLLGTSSQRYEQTSSLKKTTYPNVKGYYWTSLVNHMINTNYVYSIYIYIHINIICIYNIYIYQ